MRGKLYKLYDLGRQLEHPELVYPDDADIYNHHLYETVYAAYDNQTAILTDAKMYLINPGGLYVKGIEKIGDVYYRQEWLIRNE